MNLSTINNRAEHEHNWIQRVDDALPRSVHAQATAVDANFDVLYTTLGWQHPDTSDFVWNTYKRGKYKGQATDQIILRADNYLPMGNVSGQYPDRDGYRHVYDVLEEMFPQSCESVTMYGGGQQVVVDNDHHICISACYIAVLWVLRNVNRFQRQCCSCCASSDIKLHARNA